MSGDEPVVAAPRWRLVGAIGVFSFAAHFWLLGRRPLAHDESIDAWFSWTVRHFEVARYDPVYHGPLRFYLNAVVMWVFGFGVAEARYVAAAAGVATTVLVAASTRTLGRVGAPVAAVLFVISPTILTVTRTGREDSLIVLLSASMLLLVVRTLVEPKPWHLLALGGLLAASMAIKETTFLFGLSALLFLVGGLVIAAINPTGAARAALQRLVDVGRDAYLQAIIVFVVVFAVIFTSGFRYIEGFESGLVDGIRYWWSQHDVGRGGQPWYFYLVVWSAYEWLLIAVAIAGAVVVVRQRSPVGAWLVWMTLCQAVIYSWAGEKFAWLAVHPLVPAVLLSGLGAQAIADRLGRGPAARSVVAPVVVSVAVVLAGLTAWAAIRPAILYGADPRELLVTVQTSVDLPPVAERIRHDLESGAIDRVVVDTAGGGSWPWVWYLNDLDGVTFEPVAQDGPLPDADVVVLLAVEFEPDEPGVSVERIRMREWWVPDYANVTAPQAARWFFTRRTWNPTASIDQWVITRLPDG